MAGRFDGDGVFVVGDLTANFSRAEFACKCGCGFDTVDYDLLMDLQHLRHHFGKPIKITSGCRCAEHNKAVGGSKGSQHLYGRAADFQVQGVSPKAIAAVIDMQWHGQNGLGVYPSWVHYDTRTNGPARWDES